MDKKDTQNNNHTENDMENGKETRRENRPNNNRLGQNLEHKLGKGLDAFFNVDAKNMDVIKNDEIQIIPLDKIKAAKWQPRKYFDELEELSASIKQHGILQPILLKQVGENYEIIAGERRYRASILANVSSIPAIVKNFSEQTALEISMIENLQRKDLNPIEKAEGFAFLIEKLSLNQEELAQKLGINRSVITNFLRINKLPEKIKAKIRIGEISAGHAKILVNKENVEELAQEIVEKGLSVREIEKRVQKTTFKAINLAKNNLLNDNLPNDNFINDTEKMEKQSSEIERFEEMIAKQLGVNVKINYKSGVGNIILEFNSLHQLEEIISALCLL